VSAELHRSAQGNDVPCSKGRVSCSPRSAPLATNKAPLESSRAHEFSGMGLVGPLTFMNFIDILEVVGRRRGAIPESDFLGTHCGDSRQTRFVTNWYSCHELGGDGCKGGMFPLSGVGEEYPVIGVSTAANWGPLSDKTEAGIP